ncbi:MAG: bifunctional hydroxymethylpyrimidine kinase/phosphomethylpyrimidine kinase [Methanotrichaceae archaeon]|nr:bifunctional hydroxymethylpyrimidine kinase/phosphomethylpyrimidine kinase [Methanotrichaceae archaeon]
MLKKKVLLSIGGSDSGGGAGIQADIKTFSILGWHGTCAITAITAQNTLGVQRVFSIDKEAVLYQLESITDDFQVSFAKIGMLYSEDIVRTVAKKLDELSIPIVLDPVIEAEAGGKLLRSEAVETLKETLFPSSRVVTPNISEAEALTEINIKNLSSMKIAARLILDMGAKAVIIKGGHLDCTDLLMEEGNVNLIKGDRVKGGTHGVGCTYSAALTSFLAKGLSLRESAERAKTFATQAILRSMDVGRGVAPVNQVGCLIEEAEKFRTLSDVQSAIEMLLDKLDFVGVSSDISLNIGMAISEAGSPSEVAAVEGRIDSGAKNLNQFACIKFGSDLELAELILSAMSIDPRCRAAMNLVSESLECCTKLKLIISCLESYEEQLAISTASSSVVDAMKKADKIPFAFCNAGGLGEKFIVSLVGHSATELANVAISLLRFVNSNVWQDIN